MTSLIQTRACSKVLDYLLHVLFQCSCWLWGEAWIKRLPMFRVFKCTKITTLHANKVWQNSSYQGMGEGGVSLIFGFFSLSNIWLPHEARPITSKRRWSWKHGLQLYLVAYWTLRMQTKRSSIFFLSDERSLFKIDRSIWISHMPNIFPFPRGTHPCELATIFIYKYKHLHDGKSSSRQGKCSFTVKDLVSQRLQRVGMNLDGTGAHFEWFWTDSATQLSLTPLSSWRRTWTW